VIVVGNFKLIITAAIAMAPLISHKIYLMLSTINKPKILLMPLLKDGWCSKKVKEQSEMEAEHTVL
jgi:hypothetical protein